MSKYATKWQPITWKEYTDIYESKKLGVYSSYTNPDGDDGLTSTPQIFTSWGDDEKELIKCRRTKQNKDDKEWNDEHYKAIEWENEDD